jgi:hypothetical protein
MQNYANHTHTPRLWLAGVLAWAITVGAMVATWLGYNALAVAQLAGVVALGVALTIGRVYITALQDRIIKLEMQVRCSRFLTPAQMADLARLRRPQLVALRFASDGEVPALLARALAENLSSRAIKQAVQQWVPDDDRT